MNHPGPPPPMPYPQQGRPGGYGPPPGAYGPPPGGGYGPPPPMGGYGPPPPPPPKKSSAGKIIAIVVAVLLVLLAAGAFAAYKLVSSVSTAVGGLPDGNGCAAVSTEDVNAVLGGGQWDVVQLGGFGGIAGGVLDSRVLPDAPSCWAVQNSNGKLARIARYQGADAAQRFTAEKAKAKGTSEDRGNGVTVSTSGYLGADVQAGDEAFCTTGDMTAAAGALVRTGTTLTYVSTTAAGQGASSVPDIDVTGSSSGQVRFGTDKANCDLAVALIARMR